MGLLDRDVVLLTGGGSGLGLALAEYCIGQGARVALLEPEADRVAALAATLGPEALVIEGLATQAADLTRALQETEKRWGRLDAILCTHGLFMSEDGALATPAATVGTAFENVFQRNVFSLILIAQVFQKALATTGGALVLTAPTEALAAGHHGMLFAASQAAAQVMIGRLAQELAPKVHVSGIVCAPATAATTGEAAFGLGQFGALCAYLASRHNRGPTGQIVPVDAGILREPAG